VAPLEIRQLAKGLRMALEQLLVFNQATAEKAAMASISYASHT
jgi:hypothetical protein